MPFIPFIQARRNVMVENIGSWDQFVQTCLVLNLQDHIKLLARDFSQPICKMKLKMKLNRLLTRLLPTFLALSKFS